MKKAPKNNLIARLMDRARKTERTEQVFTIKDLDIDITLLEPTNEMVTDALSYKDGEEGDQYILYESIVDPNVKELAKELKESGEIASPIDVIDFLFKPGEVRTLAIEALNMAGYGDGLVVKKKVEEVKN